MASVHRAARGRADRDLVELEPGHGLAAKRALHDRRERGPGHRPRQLVELRQRRQRLRRQHVLPEQRHQLPGLHRAALQAAELVGERLRLGAVELAVGALTPARVAEGVAEQVAAEAQADADAEPRDREVAQQRPRLDRPAELVVAPALAGHTTV
jgi:hypothetical protein